MNFIDWSEMKNKFTDSWKNKIVFQKQLLLNKKEFESYPQHWKGFISICNKIFETKNKINLLDIGCGCGSYYKLCKDNFHDKIQYFGIDYSQEAIELCKREWDYNSFECKNIFELDVDYVREYNVLHLGALLDVLPNGDEALEFILKLNSPYLILGRMDVVSEDSNSEEYSAYSEIITYKYKHNIEKVKNLFNKNNYESIYAYNNNYLLKYKNF